MPRIFPRLVNRQFNWMFQGTKAHQFRTMRFLPQSSLQRLSLMMLLHEIKKQSHWRLIMHIIETLDKLLKDELSATETYQQTLDILREGAELGDSVALMPIYEHHKEAVSSLQAEIRQLGGTPAEDSGAWGTWAKIVLGGADLLGKEGVLKALQEGEKNGAGDYEEALRITGLPADIRNLIKTNLLPAQQAHIGTLDRLLETATD